MPGTSNPVSGTPVAGVSHTKSFRTLLGFGGGGTGGGSSVKPSFFSQLNLKAGRKSLGGPTDFHLNGRPVLVIDPEQDDARPRQESPVMLNDETDTGRPTQMPYSSSPSQENSTRSRHNHRHSLLASPSLPDSPIDIHIPSYSLNSRTDLNTPAKGLTSDTRVDPDTSGLSKHLPELSTDLSLLIDEPLPPDTASQSDHHLGSQVSVLTLGSYNYGPPRVVGNAPTSPGSSTKLEKHDRTHREDLTATRVSTRSNIPQSGLEPSSSGTASRSTDAAMESTSTSFDLSSARLSLDFMPQSLDEDWARSVIVGSSSAPSVDTSAVVPSDPSLMASSSGPLTSTPFLGRGAPPSQSQNKGPEISFNLDALDPDLVALLRPNSAKQGPSQRNRIVTPSPLEPFSPPPDPLNPETRLKRPVVYASPSASPSLSSVPAKQEASKSSPLRKFATISASTSPARRLRLPRPSKVEDIFPASTSSKPTVTPPTYVDLPSQGNRRHDNGRLPPTSAINYSDAGTPSDLSKQLSPLAATPLTLDDLQSQPTSNTAQSPTESTSTLNITTRRNGRTAIPMPTHSPNPVSTLISSIDSRLAARHLPRSFDRDSKPASTSPEVHAPHLHRFGSTGRERDRVRPPLDGLFSNQSSPDRGARRPRSADRVQPPNIFNERSNLNGALLRSRDRSQDRDLESSAMRRYRKRSMSLDQNFSGYEGRADSFHLQGDVSSRYKGLGDRGRLVGSPGHGGSEYAYTMTNDLGMPYDGRDLDKDRERYGYGYGERERSARPYTDWLGPRTAKAFAAAGLLDDAKDTAGSRYGASTRSPSEREVGTPGSGGSRDRRSSVHGGHPSLDAGRDRRYSLAASGRSSDRDFRSSGTRSGAISPSTIVSARPLSRNDSWSHSRPAPLFARTMSDLMSHRGSLDGRDSASGVHQRSGSAYSGGGGGTAGGSTGSGGGRASPTTSSSLFAAQSQIQTLKEKHDAQTEALLAALADSQKTSRELREENEGLRRQVRSLENRLVEAISNSRQKEKELSRALRAKTISSPDRTHTLISHRDTDFGHKSRPPPKPPTRRTPSPTKRRLSTSSSIFPSMPGSMSLLMAETAGSPFRSSFGSASGSSPPPSPTLVLPLSKRKSPEPQKPNGDHVMPPPQPVTMSHKRSTSGASVATSANFSFGTGSPGSLKLKPEHELFLGDMTRLSLVSGFEGDSEAEI